MAGVGALRSSASCGSGIHATAPGTAVDTEAYGPSRFNLRNSVEATAGINELIRDLPQGSYALGLPGSRTRSTERDIITGGVFLGDKPVQATLPSAQFLANPEFRNELQDAIRDAAASGVYIYAVFADAPDHVHLRVFRPDEPHNEH